MKARDKKKIERMKEGGKIISDIFRTILGEVRPGITTQELDDRALSGSFGSIRIHVPSCAPGSNARTSF